MSDDTADATTTHRDDANPADGGRGRKASPDLLARMTALGAQPTPAAAPSKPPARKRAASSPSQRTGGTKTPAKKAAAEDGGQAPAPRTAKKSPAATRKAPPAMPAEQGRPTIYSARINVTTTPEQNRALDQARLEDGLEKTTRLRAMIALWEQDERIRRRVDKLAREWR